MGKYLLVSAVFCAVVALAHAEDELAKIAPESAFDEIDQNKNGVICVDELLNWMKSKKHTVERDDVARMIRAVDFNKNGTLEKKELEELLKIRNQFIDLDGNKDQKLTYDELKTLLGDYEEKDQLELIEEVDEDADKLVDFDEFVFLVSILKGFKEFDKDGNKKMSDAEMKKFLRDSSAKVTATDVARISIAADDDDNKEIDIDEFAKVFLSLDAFRAADSNRSGHLDKAEVEAYLNKVQINIKPADVERLMKVVDEDNNDLVDLDEYTFIYVSVQNFKKVRKDKAVELEKPEVEKFFSNVKLDVVGENVDELIAVLDEDNNNKIDFDEFVELFHVYKFFKHVDDNKDKNICAAELAKFFALFNTKITAKDIARLSMIADEDNNKKIDVDEFARIYLVHTSFRAFDKDASSHLNKTELEAYLKSIKVKGAEGDALTAVMRIADEDSNDIIDVDEFAFIHISAHAFKKHDADDSGSLKKEETETYILAVKYKISPENLKELIENLDKNGDTLLDFPEFVQFVHVVKYFRYADTNNDANISDEEAEVFLDSQETKISATDLQRLKVAVDDDSNGKIDIDEFAKLVLVISAFKTYDKDNSQCLSKAEAQVFLTEAGITVTGPNLDLLYKIVDEDTNGTLDIDEFAFVYVAHMAYRVPGKQGKILRADVDKYFETLKYEISADDLSNAITALQAKSGDLEFHDFVELVQALKMFRSIDTNGDKSITKDEAEKVSAKLGQTWEGKKVAQRFDDVDLDKNGSINFHEFVAFFHVKRT